MRGRSQARPPTQRERASRIVKEIRTHFAELARLKDELSIVLDDAQNDPPHGDRDGSIGETEYGQLRSIWKATGNLLVATLFWKD